MLVTALLVVGWPLSSVFYAACVPALLAAAFIYAAGALRSLPTHAAG
jgi:hypothetical protein